MANAVFIQDPTSKYDDEPGVRYHFPKMYLKRVESCVGDWVIFYESRKGAFGYTSVQRVSSVTPDPDMPEHYYAWLDLNTLWQFEQVVPRNRPDGLGYESHLRDSTGRAGSGGQTVSAVRTLPFQDFVDIVTAGLAPMEGPLSLPREDTRSQQAIQGFSDREQSLLQYPGLADFREKILLSRDKRDASFARLVKRAYKGRCAISGLDLRNGGGRSEVQAAHIRPVADNGPDDVTNGLALSGTLHWMFDRGLISVGPQHEILVSENKVPADVCKRLISPTRNLHLPDDPRDHPHPEYLRYHREMKFGAFA